VLGRGGAPARDRARRWIFPHACTDVFETTPLGVRATLHDQAAIRVAAAARSSSRRVAPSR
jgi:hypothetical protein